MQNLTNNLGILQRLKNEIPFSRVLNEYIEQKFEALKKECGYKIFFVTDEPYFISNRTQKQAFDAMVYDINYRNKLYVWTGASECTVFGEPVINWKFRAIHDSIHIKNNLDFSAQSELIVNYLQQQIFCFDGLPEFERQILNIETAGQVLYYCKNESFPENQRKFAISELYKFYNYKANFRRPELFNESVKIWEV
jgi:hypothetical protein